MWDSIGKETFRVFRRWLKRRANGSTTAAASASLPAPRVMQPWPTPSSNVSHPSRKSKQTVGRPLVSGDAGGVNSLAASAGGAEITQEVCRRRADCARPFASALLSRGTCEMENFSDRANFGRSSAVNRVADCGTVYSPVICRTTTCESE